MYPQTNDDDDAQLAVSMFCVVHDCILCSDITAPHALAAMEVVWQSWFTSKCTYDFECCGWDVAAGCTKNVRWSAQLRIP
jgi:hypothetical protein